MTLSRAEGLDAESRGTDPQLLQSRLPPAGKDFADLILPGKEEQIAEQERHGKSSFHTVLPGFKNNQKKHRPTHYFKFSQIPDAPVAEFEAACAAIMRLYSRKVATNTRPYYEGDVLKGVASKEHENFKCNKDDPLTLDDLYLTGMELLGSEEDRERYQRSLESLSTLLAREPDGNQGYLGYFYSVVGNTVNRFKSTTTAVSIKEQILPYVKGESNLDKVNLEKLNDTLTERKTWVEAQANKGNKAYQDELISIEDLLKQGNELLDSPNIISAEFIEHMEMLDQKYPENLSRYKSTYVVDAYIGLYEHSQSVPLTIKDIVNYRIIKGLAIGLNLSYLYMEGDAHNRNLGKDGRRIDYDMMFWWLISSNWKDTGLIDILGRSPEKSKYEITARDLKNFPDVQDVGFFYWPTMQTIFSLGSSSVPSDMKSYINDLQRYMTNNFYRTHDNLVFKQLAKNPIFEFFKYKIYAQFSVMPCEVYGSLIDMNVGKETTFYHKQKQAHANLRNEMMGAVRSQRLALRKVLLNMPEFQAYYKKHKEIFIKMSVNELSTYREHYANKVLAGDNTYKGLVDSINLDEYRESLQSLAKESKTKIIGGDSRLFGSQVDIVDDYSGSDVEKSPEIAKKF